MELFREYTMVAPEIIKNNGMWKRYINLLLEYICPNTTNIIPIAFIMSRVESLDICLFLIDFIIVLFD